MTMQVTNKWLVKVEQQSHGLALATIICKPNNVVKTLQKLETMLISIEEVKAKDWVSSEASLVSEEYLLV